MRRVELGPFVVDRIIGRGGMSEVWSALHSDDDVPVAIKVLTGERARRPHALRQFRVEARAVARLDHPHIVVVHDVGEVSPEASAASDGQLHAGAPYLVMDQLPGGSLWRYRGRLAWPDLHGLLTVLLDALGHAHARGVIHRDLKPSNVLLSVERRAVLCDFGLAMFPDRETDGVIRAGTPSYMAPEQLENRWRDFGPWTDLYGFGCLVWTLVAGMPPFKRSGWEDPRVLRAESDPPPLLPLQSVPNGFEGWLRRLLEWDPAERLQCAADAAYALEQVEPDDLTARDLVSLVEPDPLGAEVTVPRVKVGGPRFTALYRGPGRRDAPPPVSTEWRGPRPLRRLHLRGAGLGLWGARAIPAIGRNAERDVLWNALVMLFRTPKARAVLLEGPAGVGKTHLAHWLCETAHEKGAASAWWVSHHRDAPGGLANSLRAHFHADGLSEDEMAARVHAVAASYGTTDPNDRALLVDLVKGGTTEATAGAPDRIKVLARHLRAVGARRPVVMVIDEAERATDALLFARWVLSVRDSDPTPVLFVIASRDEVRSRSGTELLSAIAQSDGVDRVHVDPLTEDQQLELVRELLGLEGELARRVAARTGGNPAFAIALVEDWVARGVLVRAEGGFRLRDGSVAQFPDDLHVLWSQDLAHALVNAPDAVWVGLELAAVLGMRVETPEWTAIAHRIPGATASVDALDVLFARRLLRTTHPAESFRFAHPMVRESLLRRASDAKRLEILNEAVLEHLRAVDPSLVDDRRMARHLLIAQRTPEAIRRLLQAARRLYLAGNLHGTLDLCDQADEARATAPDLGGEFRRQILLERARALLGLARLDEAELAALGVAGDAGAAVVERCEARIVLAGVTILRGHPQDVRVPLAEVVAAAREVRAFDSAARALAMRARAEHVLEAAEEALTYATEARRLALDAKDRMTWASATCHLARALAVLGHPREAVKLLNEGLTVEHPAVRAELLSLLGDLLRRHGGDEGRGDQPSARASYEEAADLLDRLGSLEVVGPRARLAVLLLTQGAYAEAWRLAERCRREALLQGRPPVELEVHVILLAAAMGLDDRPAAEEQAARVLALAGDGVRCGSEYRSLLVDAARRLRGAGDAALADALTRVARLSSTAEVVAGHVP